ncbi:5-oxoprolinase subunit PxpB [Algibacter miyuki]|uniref:5-oxoprolinase subunit PxpB n=1 Tax=Algibacter miyuki TaxID=1306933 RepID=A0ABV5H2I7_9FLAO|nr:5-oxoprolinase subunit PxpB [Algibacter miyuki]MDN3664103.1 5-oxoprolinase subunit PxpB [Algibacter miyuki]
MAFKLQYKTYGAHAVLVEWPAVIDEIVLRDVLYFKDIIEKSNIKYLVQVNSAYNSLIVIYDESVNCLSLQIVIIDKIYATRNKANISKAILWRIPVCYDALFSLDLASISGAKNMSEIEFIKQHSEAVYTVYFIGFLPGFLYLGGLNKALQTPRKSTPRLHVEKGAVAIGGNQTGVYPNTSPGGWNIIGNSPINFFDISKEKPCFAKAGDRVQFYPVSLEKHQEIKVLVEAGVYQIENSIL